MNKPIAHASITKAWTVSGRASAPPPGAHLPFTAPLLVGCRGRLREGAIDYILPSLSGGRGTYVALWGMVNEFAAPTLHDAVLARRLQGLSILTSSSVRAIARAVADEGYAGRAAAVAAARAQAVTQAESLRLWAMLLMALIRGSSIPEREHVLALASLGNAGPGVSTDGFRAVAQRLGWEPALLSEGLEQIASALLPVAETGRARRVLALMRKVEAGLAEEQAQQLIMSGAQPPGLLERTIRGVGHRLGQSETLFQNASAIVARPLAMLNHWRTDPPGALAPVTAVEESLDGWDRICLLWLDATTVSARIGILPEIGLLVRLSSTDAGIPPAAGARAGSDPPPPAATEPKPARDAPAPTLIERNERIRALELELDHGNG